MNPKLAQAVTTDLLTNGCMEFYYVGVKIQDDSFLTVKNYKCTLPSIDVKDDPHPKNSINSMEFEFNST